MKEMRRPFAVRRGIPAALFALAVTAHASAAWAEQGAIVSATVSATSIDAGISPGITGSFAYRFTNIVGLGLEVSWVPALTPEAPTIPNLAGLGGIGSAIYPPVPILPAISVSADGGHAVIVSSNVRLEIPTRSRFAPYVIAGGGVGTVEEDLTLKVSAPDVIIQSAPDLAALGFTPLPIADILRAYSQPISRSFTDVALTAGGGIDIRLSPRWAVDVDLRYTALIGSRDLHIGRYGGGISYKF
jgi:opacity protein-like surface antigen